MPLDKAKHGFSGLWGAFTTRPGPLVCKRSTNPLVKPPSQGVGLRHARDPFLPLVMATVLGRIPTLLVWDTRENSLPLVEPRAPGARQSRPGEGVLGLLTKVSTRTVR